MIVGVPEARGRIGTAPEEQRARSLTLAWEAQVVVGALEDGFRRGELETREIRAIATRARTTILTGSAAAAHDAAGVAEVPPLVAPPLVAPPPPAPPLAPRPAAPAALLTPAEPLAPGEALNVSPQAVAAKASDTAWQRENEGAVRRTAHALEDAPERKGRVPLSFRVRDYHTRRTRPRVRRAQAFRSAPEVPSRERQVVPEIGGQEVVTTRAPVIADAPAVRAPQLV